MPKPSPHIIIRNKGATSIHTHYYFHGQNNIKKKKKKGILNGSTKKEQKRPRQQQITTRRGGTMYPPSERASLQKPIHSTYKRIRRRTSKSGAYTHTFVHTRRYRCSTTDLKRPRLQPIILPSYRRSCQQPIVIRESQGKYNNRRLTHQAVPCGVQRSRQIRNYEEYECSLFCPPDSTIIRYSLPLSWPSLFISYVYTFHMSAHSETYLYILSNSLSNIDQQHCLFGWPIAEFQKMAEMPTGYFGHFPTSSQFINLDCRYRMIKHNIAPRSMFLNFFKFLYIHICIHLATCAIAPAVSNEVNCILVCNRTTSIFPVFFFFLLQDLTSRRNVARIPGKSNAVPSPSNPRFVAALHTHTHIGQKKKRAGLFTTHNQCIHIQPPNATHVRSSK